jgi:sugar lactone lactonase YvrE
VDGRGATARFNLPSAIVSDGAGDLYVADVSAIRKVVIATRAVTTLAGSGAAPGAVDGVGADARFNQLTALALDGAGGLYVVDSYNHTIRKIVLTTKVVMTLAGSATESGYVDGVGVAAGFNNPASIDSDGGNTLFVADSAHNVLRKVDIATGALTTLAGAGWPGSADGPGPDASFNAPMGVAADGAGNLFVADTGNHTVRQVVVATGAVTTLAGAPGQIGAADGAGAAASFSGPAGLASDGMGNLFVADTGNSTIRKIAVATGVVTTLAGAPGQTGTVDGAGVDARFSYPVGVVADGAGNLYVTDTGNSTVRKIVIATGAVTTLAGSARQPGSADGTGAAAGFNYPYGITRDGAGNLYLADTGNGTIRKLAVQTATVSTVLGASSLETPYGLVVLPTGALAITDFSDNAVLMGRL